MSFDHARQFIGASECASIIGLDDYKTKIAIWDRLVNGTIGEDSPMAKRGRALESALIAFYADETKHRVLAPVVTKTHEKFAFIGATPDGLDQDEPFVIEAKAPSFRTHALWADGDIPARYVVQTQIQCAVFARPEARVVVDLGDRIEIRDVAFDGELAGEVIEQVAKFHRDHVVTGKAPEPDGSASHSDYLARRFPSVRRPLVEATPDIESLADAYRRAREQNEAAEIEAERLKQELQSRMGDAGKLVGSFGSISWNDTKGRTSVDYKALVAELQADPALIAKYTKQGSSFRTFRCTWAK